MPEFFPRVDWSPIGQIPEIIRRNRINAARQEILGSGQLDQTAVQRLLQIGDTEGAMSIAGLADRAQQRALAERQFGLSERQFGETQSQHAWQQQHQEAEARRQQSNIEAERTFKTAADLRDERRIKLAEEAAREKPTTQVFEDADGNKHIIKIEPYGKGASVLPVTGLEGGSPSNPYAVGGKQTEAQSKDALYASRMFHSEKILRDVESSMTDPLQRGMSKIPFAGNFLVNQQYQSADQAMRDFINATLRRESGAVISPSEFDNANKQYFPQPGDSPETIKQKRANRMEAIKGIAGGAGKGWRPPFTFDEAGGMVKAQSRAPAPLSPEARADAISQARIAVTQQNKEPRIVADMLRKMGIDPAEAGL